MLSRMSKNFMNYGQLSAQGLFDKGGEYLADVLKERNNTLAQHHQADPLHSENQQIPADQFDILLSDPSNNRIKEKFEKQNASTDETTEVVASYFNYYLMKSLTCSEFPVMQPQEKSINNNLSKSIVTKEIAQVLKEMGFHVPIDCTSGNMSVDELKDYCDLYSSIVDNECIMEIVGALLG
jgi:hypothetical protein